MKFSLISSLTIVMWATASGQIPFMYETDAVMTSAGDFATNDGRKDLVVVDKASGSISFGRQNVDGTITWSVPEPTGIMNATGLTVARFEGGIIDRAAITAPAANRVTLANLNPSATQVVFRHIYPTYTSPKGLAAFDPDANGTAEMFVVGDRLTPSPRYYYEFLGNLIGSATPQWEASYGVDTTRIYNFVQKAGTPAIVAENYGSQFYVEAVTATGLSVGRALPGLAVSATSLMTYGNFDGSLLSQIVIYNPGATTASAAKVTEATPGTFGWAGVTTMTFPRAIRQLVTIPTVGAARLGVVFMDGSAASYDYDGTNLTLRSNLAGNGFEWLCPIGADLLIARNSAGWARFHTVATSVNLAAASSGSFPNLSVKNKVSNVVFLSGEPFVNPEAAPVAQGAVRSWSTAASGAGTSWNVSAADVFATGIGGALSTSYTSSNSATHTLVNQYRGNISIRNLEAAAGPSVVDIGIQPPGGIYRSGSEITLTFQPTAQGYGVRYRIGSAAWTNYNIKNPPMIEANSVVEAYAFAGNLKSPTRSASYTFSSAPVLGSAPVTDANSNGMGDAWEKSFNLTNPSADADGDGSSNLAEYLAGTDPRNAADMPPLSGDLVLNIAQLISGSNTTLRLTWDTALEPVLLESSDSLLLGTWTTISSGITISGTQSVYDISVPPGGGKRFFRLRKP